jgi:hypothetical protein
MTAIENPARRIGGGSAVLCLLVLLLTCRDHVLAADGDTTAVAAEVTPPSPMEGLETGNFLFYFGFFTCIFCRFVLIEF